LCLLALIGASIAACSAGRADGTSSSSSGKSSSSSTGGAGGAGGDIFTVGAGGEGGFLPSGSGGGENCLESSQEAIVSPLDVMVLLDRSGSMSGALWDGSVAALESFFQNPGATEISAGISYFPPPGNALECQPSSYDPPHVPVVDLATDAATLVSDMQSQTPAGDDTPTYAGLYGTLVYANDYQDQNPDHVVIVVLASDGDPTACNTDVGDISDLAATAHAYNGVRTFVIAIQGATVANLDQIAAAGGTMAALDVTSDITQFQQALDDIRKEVLACEYVIPDPEDQEFDPTKVNVEYTSGAGDTESIPQADDLADCGDDPGWYYDNPQNPTKIIFCPATCDLIQSDDMAKVDFIFGCPTIVN
jgi:hypothetical protein